MKKTNVYYRYRLEKTIRESPEIKDIQDVHHISETYLVFLTKHYGLSEIRNGQWEIQEGLRVFIPKEIWATMPQGLPLRLYLEYKKII